MQAKILFVLVICLLTLPNAFSAPIIDKDAEKIANELMRKQPSEILPGRYQILFSPHVRSDTFLLDTVSGDCYQQRITRNGEQVWAKMRHD